MTKNSYKMHLIFSLITLRRPSFSRKRRITDIRLASSSNSLHSYMRVAYSTADLVVSICSVNELFLQ